MILNYFHELNKLDETWELEEVFETHDELNQQLFDNDILRKDIRKRLLEIVDLFIGKIREDNIPIDVIDYWLLGSNAAYNYGPKSDIDIHIIVNLEDLGVDPYILQVLYNYIKSDFNNKYDIEVKGHEVELYLEDVRSGAVTNGIYSLKQNRWIKFPIRIEYMRFDVTETDEYKDWYQRYLSLKDNEIEQFINDLYLMRKESLATEGEWGTGNLVFKEFRNLGYLDSLKDRKYEYKSKELTLESLNKNILCEKHWIEAQASDGTSSYDFTFYATDNNPAADLDTLIPIINGTQTGTYKQSLDKTVLNNIKALYDKNNPAAFTLRMIRALPAGVTPYNRITLMDRDLRKEASNQVYSGIGLTSSQKLHLSKYGCNELYVHHMNKHEDDNSINNLLVVGYPSGNLGLAHATHQLIHNGKPSYPPNITLTPGTHYIVPYVDCDTGHLGDVEFIIN